MPGTQRNKRRTLIKIDQFGTYWAQIASLSFAEAELETILLVVGAFGFCVTLLSFNFQTQEYPQPTTSIKDGSH